MNKLLTLTAVAACALTVSAAFADDPPLPIVQPVVFRVVGLSYQLTGRDLNGTSLNGKVLDGRTVASVSYDGASRDGAELHAVRLDGSELRGITVKGKHLSGDDLVGVTFEGTLDDGDSVELRVDGMRHGLEKWNRDVVSYSVSYATTDGWSPLCGTDEAGEPIGAIALEGTWDQGMGSPGGGSHIDDPSAFTLACESHALGTCVNMGYKPWQAALVCSHGSGCRRTTLADVHQACVRMLRADYCGDGVSYTVDGTAIAASDAFAIRAPSASWVAEGEWNAGGAVCLSRQRIANGPVPACMDRLQAADCGNPSHLSTGSLMISQIAGP